MVPNRTVALTLQLIVIATIVRHDSGEIITKDFTKTAMSGSVIDLSGYNQLQAVTRKLDCAKQCSEDDTCSNFYYTSSEHICYLSGSSTSHVYRIQTASFAFYKLNDGALGCPVNGGGWFVLEKDSNIMFSLFTTTANFKRGSFSP
ncbi:uncharacterized protein LOC132719353 [Ruditapes philippinarum]|uniref:uncharacterized protein LOC132719353 n=1 Tax=Ruditapes philippinarum TaxID=129788 RepID=UPI00295AD133|nr:uncharacterized protein LOC132719353 [Ruditapes philippinarum]